VEVFETCEFWLKSEMQLISVVTFFVRSDCEPQLLQTRRFVELSSRLQVLIGNWKFVRHACVLSSKLRTPILKEDSYGETRALCELDCLWNTRCFVTAISFMRDPELYLKRFGSQGCDRPRKESSGNLVTLKLQ